MKTFLKKSVVVSAVKALNNKIGHYRTIRVSGKDEMLKHYFDEDLNPIFQGLFLETEDIMEQNINTNSNNNSNSNDNYSLVTLLERMNTRLEKEAEFNLKDVKNFNLNKYDGKTTIFDFLKAFESECGKNQAQSDKNKIEALRFFLEGTAAAWYEGALKKFGEDWESWKKAMITIFGAKNFSNVANVYEFKYIGGRLIDYGIKKENLILDLNEKTLEMTRIDMIVMGLPKFIQNKLNRNKLSNIEDLFKELALLDGQIDPKFEKKKKESNAKKETKKESRKPCSICSAMKKPDRYHLEEECWFNDKNKKVNITDIENIDSKNVLDRLED